MVWAVAGATMVEAVAVWALAAASGGAGHDQVQAGGNDNPPAAASGAPAPDGEVRLTSFEEVLTLDNPLAHVPEGASLSITDMVVRNPDGDTGTFQLKRAEQVQAEAPLEHLRDFDLHYNQPISADPGVLMTLAVNCTASVHDCHGVRVTITGYTVVLNR